MAIPCQEMVMRNKSASQKGTGGSTPVTKYSVGSGSRPGGGKLPIPSSNPPSAKNIRGK